MLRNLIVISFIVGVMSACQKDPLVILCQPEESWGDKVAIRIEEDKEQAQLLDTITLRPATFNPFVRAYISPTMISLYEADEKNFWLLDRSNGRLSRNNPYGRYYCSTKRAI